MTREQRQRQAQNAVAMCERIAPRLKAQGSIAAIPDAQLERMFNGVELRAAQWLRFVAERCTTPKRTKDTAETSEAMLIEGEG